LDFSTFHWGYSFFYYKGIPFEEVDLASLQNEGLEAWMETNRKQGGVLHIRERGRIIRSLL